MCNSFSEKSREEQLKEIIYRIHDGEKINDLKKEFQYLLKHLSAEEITSMEQSLLQEGVTPEEIQNLCDIHVEVFEDSLKKNIEKEKEHTHPVTVFKQENRELESRLKEIKKILKNFKKTQNPQTYEQLQLSANQLKEFEKHYIRKENQLFPRLEAAGFTGPTTVMWGKHDEIRGELKAFLKLLNNADSAASSKELSSRFSALSKKMEKMIFMEEKILYPASLKKLTDKDWDQIRKEEQEIGLAWLAPTHQEKQMDSQLPDSSELVYNTSEEDMMNKLIQIPLHEGIVTQQQLDLMLQALPFDLTFVDENDQVRYYSATDDRIFPRTPSIIGRTVQNCHPPKSVHIVEKIVASFKNKEKTSAEFWIDLQGRKVHIRYFPVYDASGNYRGTIEVSQDITDIQKLEGEKRLLDWE